MGEEARQCSRCGYRWFAKRSHKPANTYGAGAGWSVFGQQGMAAAAGAKAGTHYRTRLERYERWRLCAQCGSQKVTTQSKRGFIPTAAEQRPAPPHSPPVKPALDNAPKGLGRSIDSAPETPPRTRRWPKWLAYVLIALIVGPILVICGEEATRRTPEHGPHTPLGRRQRLVVLAGMAGTAFLGGGITHEIMSSLAAPPSEGAQVLGALVGASVGFAIALGLVRLARGGTFHQIPLPRALTSSDADRPPPSSTQ